MRVVVVTPPPFVLASPAAAPSVLTAVLRERGHEAMCFDASRFCVDALLTPKHVGEAGHLGGQLLPGVAAGLALAMPEVVATMESMSTYASLDRYDPARAAIEEALGVLASAHGATRWTSVQFHGDHDRADPDSLFAAVRRGREVFDRVLPEAMRVIASFEPGLVAISVSFPEQLYGALRIGNLVRTQLADTKVVMGGASTTRVRASLTQLPELFDFVDFLQLREGELPLAALADALAARRDPLDLVPGLYARRVGMVVASTTPARGTFPLGQMPVPIFDDLSPGPYLSPQPLLPVSTTRNCYFDRCTFCAISRSFNDGFRMMPADRMLSQAHTLRARHPGAIFKDVSEAIPPAAIFKYAEMAAATGDPPPFEAYLRLEPPFAVPDAGQRLFAGGLRTVYFGLESASANVLQQMRKEINIDVAQMALRRFADAGIWCHLFLIAGHPGETEADHEMSLHFLRRNRSWIHSIQAQPFGLAVDSDLASTTEQYAMKVRERSPTTLSFDLEISDWGRAPGPEVARRRARDLRRLAYSEADDTLSRSRLLWDAHRVVFVEVGGKLAVPGTSDLSHRSPSWIEPTAEAT